MTNGAPFLLKLLPESERPPKSSSHGKTRATPAPAEVADAEGEWLLAPDVPDDDTAPPPPPPPPLPPPGAGMWDVARDADTGRRYFFSREGGLAAWHLPEGSVATPRARAHARSE